MTQTAECAQHLPAYEALLKLAEENAGSYKNAEPYPHVVLDNFFSAAVLENVLREFPSPQVLDWVRFDSPKEKKIGSKHESQIPSYTRGLLHTLNSGIFLEFLERLTGIQGLLPDPHFKGGGLHQIERGGFLNVHADFNWYKRLQVHRRLNLLLYLNKDWQEEYGGHFQMWDAQMGKCRKKVLPVFNRMVIFSTTDHSFHGHPEPLACPEGETRKSLALYYYTAERPWSELSAQHSTLFQTISDGDLSGEKLYAHKLGLKAAFLKWTPPVLADLFKKK